MGLDDRTSEAAVRHSIGREVCDAGRHLELDLRSIIGMLFPGMRSDQRVFNTDRDTRRATVS